MRTNFMSTQILLSRSSPKYGVGRLKVASIWILHVLLGIAVSVNQMGCKSEAGQSEEIERRLANIEKQLAEVTQKLAALDHSQSDHKASEDVSKPVIKADESVHDLGTSWAAATLKHTFTVTNVGTSELKISKVKPGCGCMVAGTYPKELKPGESGKFPFTLNTKTLRGKYSKSIRITSNDPVTPELKLTLRGENKMYVDVSPPSAIFGSVYGDQPHERVLKITNNAEQPLQLRLDDEEAQGKCKLELSEKEAGKRFDLRVSIAPPYAPGTQSTKVKLHTNVDAQKTVEILVHVRVPERIDVSPKTIVAFDKPGAELASGSTYLTNYGTTPVKVVGAVTDDPNINVEVREQTSGKKYHIKLQMPSDYELPDGRRKLILKTDDPEKPTIQVPIRRARSGRGAQTASGKPVKKPVFELLGRPVPEFSLTTLRGKTVSNADFIRYRATILNFMAPDCSLSRRQIPMVEAIRAEFQEKGVRFVNISETMKKTFTDEEAAAVMESVGSHLELAPDPANKVGKSFKATSYPTVLIVNQKGKVEHVNVGAKPNLDKTLRNQLSGLLRATR